MTGMEAMEGPGQRLNEKKRQDLLGGALWEENPLSDQLPGTRLVDDDSGRITLPPASSIRRLKNQVQSGLLAVAQSIVESNRSAWETACRDRMDEADEGCIITNVHRHSDQMAHWVNAQRSDATLRNAVENLLRELGVVPMNFNLNHISNLSWLDASLHIGLDKYDLFAITATQETCRNLKDYLNRDFAYRQAVVDSGGGASNRLYRHLDFTINLQFVPLHPYQICPQGLPLLRRDPLGTYHSYLVCVDGLFRETNDPRNITATPFFTFEHQTTRLQHEKLNIWLVMMNADIKFRRFIKNYGSDALHPDLKPVVDETIEIIQLVYKQLDLGDLQPARRSTRNTNKSPVGAEREDSGSDTEREPEGGGDEEILGGDGQSSGWQFPLDRWTSDMATRPGCPPLIEIYRQLPHEERMEMCRDLFSRGSMYREDEMNEMNEYRSSTSLYSTRPETLAEWVHDVGLQT